MVFKLVVKNKYPSYYTINDDSLVTKLSYTEGLEPSGYGIYIAGKIPYIGMYDCELTVFFRIQ